REAVVVLVDVGIAARRNHTQGGPVVAVIGYLTIEPDGADADHSGVGSGVDRGRRAVIPGCGDDQCPFVVRVLNGVVETFGGLGGPETDVDDAGAAVCREADAVHQSRGRAGAIGTEHFHGHQVGIRGNSGAAVAVIRGLGDGPGHVSAVAVVVVGMG